MGRPCPGTRRSNESVRSIGTPGDAGGSQAGSKPRGEAQDVVTGFLNDRNEARGRPVGVAVDKTGAMLIADDVGNRVWRVTASGS
ncbi:glucose/arabinose dehydrogenase [Bradyrhizobium sp. USDA 4369]